MHSPVTASQSEKTSRSHVCISIQHSASIWQSGVPWAEHGLAAMHTWPNQAGTALLVSIVMGEVAPPPTRFDKGSPLLWPNQVKVVCLPACARQLDISLVRGKAWPVCMSVWHDTRGEVPRLRGQYSTPKVETSSRYVIWHMSKMITKYYFQGYHSTTN